MGNRISTSFQNILEQQLRTMQSIVVYLVRIEEILEDIRDGRLLAIPETENSSETRRQMSPIHEEIEIIEERTITLSTDNSNRSSVRLTRKLTFNYLKKSV